VGSILLGVFQRAHRKVMLMSGLTVGAFAKFLSEKTTELDKPFHLHNLLKFVALRKDRSAIMAAGGTWDPEVDGGDPAIDDTALIRAVIRCTKDSTQLDLTACKVWTRFLEVHYERLGGDGLPSHKEITVIFFPTLFDCVPSPEVWQTQWIERRQAKLKLEAASKEEKEAPTEEVEISKEGDSNGVKHEKEEAATAVQEDVTVDNEIEVDDSKRKLSEDKITAVQQNGATQVLLPKVKEQVIVKEEEAPLPGLVLTTKQTKTFKMRSMTISLDGLLDYDEEDREECTFELSLFAEVFQEFLQFKMGTRILSNLEMLRQNSYARWKQERKHKLDNKKETDAEGSSSQRKRSKFSDKLDVVVMKAEVEVRIEASLKTEEQPKRVEQNGIEGERTKDNMSNNIKKEPDVVDSQDTDICSNVHVETKETQIEGTHCIMETKEMDAEMTEAAATTDPILEEKLKDHKVETRMVVDEELLLAYCYFDKNKVGYLKSDDIRRLLHSLGMFLSHRIVKELVVSAVLESNKSARNDHITYRCFTEKEVEVDTTLAAG